MSETLNLQKRVDDAAAQVCIEVAFLVPRGTDLKTHPISAKLAELVRAVRAHERAALAALHAAPSKEPQHQWWCGGKEPCACTDSWKTKERQLLLTMAQVIAEGSGRVALLEAIENLKRELESADPLASGGWQPIESVPKNSPDGPEVLVSDGVNIGMGEWCDCDDGHWIIYGGWPHTINTPPTFWMPLPAPPLPAEPETKQTPQKQD